MNKTYQASLSLVLPSQECQKCHQTSSQSHSAFNNIWFYCQKCEIYTKWNHGTILQTSNLSPSHIDVLLEMFLTNKTPSDALDILAYSFVNQSLNITTIRRYFLIFCNVVLDYYEEQMSSVCLFAVPYRTVPYRYRAVPYRTVQDNIVYNITKWKVFC